MRRAALIFPLVAIAAFAGGWVVHDAMEAGPASSLSCQVDHGNVAGAAEARQTRLRESLHGLIDCLAANGWSATADDGMALAGRLGVPWECDAASRAPELQPVEQSTPRYEMWLLSGSTCGGTLPSSGLLARPSEGPGPFPLVVAVHGTAASPEVMSGIEDPSDFETEEYHNELVLRLLDQGYAVLAPRLVTDATIDPVSGFNGARNRIDRRLRALGSSLVGVELATIKAMISDVSTFAWVDDDRIGAYGISLGGMLAFYHAALDDRIDAVVVSQWLEDRSDKLVSRSHPDALWKLEDADYAILPLLPEYDDVGVAEIISPRAIFAEAGEQDVFRTGRLISAWPSFIESLGDRPNYSLCLEVTPGAHEVWFEGSSDFLAYWLDGEVRGGLAELCG